MPFSLWAGQSVGLVSKVRPAGDIVREIADEARSTLQTLGGMTAWGQNAKSDDRRCDVRF